MHSTKGQSFSSIFSSTLNCIKISYPVPGLCENGYAINRGRYKCSGMHEGLMTIQGVTHQGVYRMNATQIPPWSTSKTAYGAVDNRKEKVDSDAENDCVGIKLWHERLGHSNKDSIKRWLSSGPVTGLGKPKRGKSPSAGCMKVN